jgi:NADH-quinone oxidoreductase subunit L
MVRSYYLTFTGTYRGGEGHEEKESLEDPDSVPVHAVADAALHAHSHAVAADDVRQAAGAHAADQHSHDASRGAHHGGVPHESPRSMTWVLIALAFAAVVSGVIFGLPALWSGHEPLLERWLAPSLPAAEKVPFAEESHATEWLFQLIGVGIATAGWFAARMLYLDAKSAVPEMLKERFARAWAVVYNKYYVDELYQATVVRSALALSRVLYWVDQNVIDRLVNFMAVVGRTVAYVDAAIDRYVVDGAVNGLGNLVVNSGKSLRRLQTGHINAYLFGALGGALFFVILQYVIR